MENSILLARIIGPLVVVIGFSVLWNRNNYRVIIEDFFKNSALIYVTGVMTFVAGLSTVLFHNIWSFSWHIIITLFGWNALIKGALLIIAPEAAAKITSPFIQNIRWVLFPWIIFLAIGIFLVMRGYF